MSVEKIVLQPLGNITATAAKRVAKQTPTISTDLPSGLEEKILEKLSFFFKKFPAYSKTNNPVKINFENSTVAFTMDKTLPENRTKIVLKDLIQDVTEFSKRVPQQSSLEILLDKNGQAISGDLCTHLGYKTYDHIKFERARRNIRRIQYAGTQYMPVSNSNHWVPVTKTQSTHASTRGINGYLLSDAGRNNNLEDALQHSSFGKILQYFTELKTTL